MKGGTLEETLNRRLERLIVEMCADEIRLPHALREFEKKYLQVALQRCGGNRTRAARLLGVHRNTLGNKIQSHRL